MSSSSTRNAWATGLAVFAAAMMITVGVFQILQGIVALANDQFYVVGLQYAYEFDLTTWGWIHLILGIVLVVVGGFLFTGAGWARGVGIAITSLVMIANFMWLPYYPLWSIVLIALNAAVIWGLAVYEPYDDSRA